MSEEHPKGTPQSPPTAINAIMIPQLARLGDKKQAVLVIEGLVHGIKNGSFPLQWYDPTAAGVMFIKQIHDALIASLTPEELDQFKKEQSPTPVASVPTHGNGHDGTFMQGMRRFLGGRR